MTPNVLVVGGYRFVIFTADHGPAHVHVLSAERVAKFDLDPVMLVENRGFLTRELRKIERIIVDNQQLYVRRLGKHTRRLLMGKKLAEKDQAVAIDIRDERVWLTLRDGRIVSMPLSFFPWLEQATPEERANYVLAPFAIHWPDLGDGIDVYAFVTGEWLRPPALTEA